MRRQNSLNELRSALLRWFDAAKRDLPWRRTSDPYAIWVSEIMLQQTRVAAVTGHYARFLERYPTVASLAAAPLDDVLAAWSGLGYYRRARMMHKAAQHVTSQHNAALPETHEAILALPGIGAYTAAAVGSIAFGLPLAAVDGNVERVLARVAGEANDRGAARWRVMAQQWLDPARPGDFNQAMMELGSEICTPKSPKCAVCPIYRWCRTRGENATTPRLTMRSQQELRGLVLRGGRVLLEQRPADARRMAGMWELPLMLAAPDGNAMAQVRHSITNTNYAVQVFAATAKTLPPPDGARKWHALTAVRELPLTGLTLKVLKQLALA